MANNNPLKYPLLSEKESEEITTNIVCEISDLPPKEMFKAFHYYTALIANISIMFEAEKSMQLGEVEMKNFDIKGASSEEYKKWKRFYDHQFVVYNTAFFNKNEYQILLKELGVVIE